MTSKPKQTVDAFTFTLMWLLAMLFIGIPKELVTVKLVVFCLAVCAAFLCFVESQQKATLKEVN